MNIRNIIGWIAAIALLLAIASTAHASLYGWSTCVHGGFGKTQVRGHVTCSQGSALLDRFQSHLRAMQARGDEPYAGRVDEFHPYAAGRPWDCFYKINHYSSLWDCFNETGSIAEFRFLSTAGMDTRTVVTPAPAPPRPTGPVCGHCVRPPLP